MSHKKASGNAQRSELDRSIDLGMDQFGRFLKRSWLWLFLIILVALFFSSVIRIPGVNPGTVLAYAFQIIFAIFFVIIQFVALFWFLGRPRSYWVLPGETGVTFADYKGNPEVLEAARRIVTLIGGVKAFQAIGGQPVRGLLLTGDPGTGKSYLAQCMSTEAGVPFGYVSAASLQSMFMGMNVLIIIRLYAKARRFAREYGGCVLFLDEIDAIGGARNNGMGMGMGMMGGMMGGGGGGLNQLLMEMDPPSIETNWFKKILRTLGLSHGRAQSQPVLTIGATNVPESLDRALLRPGRFDRKINVAPPTDKYRPEVIEYYLNKVQHEPGISIATVSARLVNYTPVAIKHVVNEAVIIAHFAGRDKITYKDLVEAQDVHEFGLRQLSELTSVERRRLAYHEAGHAVACYYLMDRYFPAFVTLHMHGDLEGAAAFAAWRQTETIITNTREDVLARVQVSLASRAAEELFLNTQLNGVTSDFASATRLASLYIGAYGMDGTLTSYLAFADPIAGGTGAIQGQSQLMERVEELLQSQMRAVKQLFLNHSEALMAVAEALIEHDELVAEEIKSLIDNADARTAAQAVFNDFQPLLDSATNGCAGRNLLSHTVTSFEQS
ncbi:AAA family ATPase [Tengunoibacter tsumagoiensis]|uniref:ATPase n=1 Tax=Tengunoibacter tsumagoiensis TaxID=2014871 RepID=A0A401ZTT8_9CHLR|nr:AAA family ATPase [Tengunoibacter tsumagoiensis]GCE10277.1 ATPase [Tengunoibacter tsumagoiensis]